MSLELLLNIICDLAIKRNLVGYAAAGPSIYSLNNETIKEYPFIFVSPTSNVVTRKNFTDYTLTFFYVDRLLADSTNETHIFSIANDSIVNLLRQLKSLEGIVDVSEPNVRLFTETERMADRCAGGYSEVTVTVLNDANCPVFFDEGENIMGTYIPQTLRDLNILDSLATKEYVIKYVNEHSSSGGTDVEEVKRLINEALEKYTKTVDFATINGSGITSGETFSLVEKSEYDTEVERIYSAITEATPQGYDELVQKVSGNSADITELYNTVSSLTEDVETEIDGLQQDVSSITQDLSVLSGITSGNSEAINELRTAVSANTDNIEILSGITSGVSEALQTLSAAVNNKQDVLSAGSGISIDNNSVSVKIGEGLVFSGDTIVVSGGTGDETDIIILNLTELTGKTAAQLTEIWEETEQAYLQGKYIILKTGNPYLLPLIKYSPHNDGQKYTGYFGFSAIDGGGNAFYDINFCWRGIFQGNFMDSASRKIMYTLPTASSSTKGGVKIGSGLTMNGEVLSTQYQIWTGTQEDYDLLASKDSNTFYVII